MTVVQWLRSLYAKVCCKRFRFTLENQVTCERLLEFYKAHIHHDVCKELKIIMHRWFRCCRMERLASESKTWIKVFDLTKQPGCPGLCDLPASSFQFYWCIPQFAIDLFAFNFKLYSYSFPDYEQRSWMVKLYALFLCGLPGLAFVYYVFIQANMFFMCCIKSICWICQILFVPIPVLCAAKGY